MRKDSVTKSDERLEGKAESANFPTLVNILRSIRQVHLYPVMGLLFLAGWIRLSAENGNLFMDKILVAGFIITCIFFLKALDSGNIPDKQDN